MSDVPADETNKEVPAVPKAPIVYRFFGDGSEYHSGIPAQDLSQAQVDLLDDERQQVLSASPLYKYVGPEAHPPTPSQEGEEAATVPQKKGKKGGE